MVALARTPRAAARRDTFAKVLIDASNRAFEPVKKKERKAPRHTPSSFFYGWRLAMEATGLLDAEGKPTGFNIVRKFSHQPGDVIVSRGSKSTNGARVRYMVQPNHSLKRI